MPPSSTIQAATKTGTVIIESGEGLKRCYSWEGATRCVSMWPREERWYGSLGMYYPGPGAHWRRHNGITRGLLEEGQQHFKTIEEAMNWLNRQSQFISSDFVYNDTGLVVNYSKFIETESINVDVWQIYINGEKPKTLKGSNNSEILTSWDDDNLVLKSKGSLNNSSL